MEDRLYIIGFCFSLTAVYLGTAARDVGSLSRNINRIVGI